MIGLPKVNMRIGVRSCEHWMLASTCVMSEELSDGNTSLIWSSSSSEDELSVCKKEEEEEGEGEDVLFSNIDPTLFEENIEEEEYPWTSKNIPIKTEHELNINDVIQEESNFPFDEVPDHMQLKPLGFLYALVDNFLVIQSNVQHVPLNIESLLALSNRHVLGKVQINLFIYLFIYLAILSFVGFRYIWTCLFAVL